jgi:hypothetical protein
MKHIIAPFAITTTILVASTAIYIIGKAMTELIYCILQ